RSEESAGQRPSGTRRRGAPPAYGTAKMPHAAPGTQPRKTAAPSPARVAVASPVKSVAGAPPPIGIRSTLDFPSGDVRQKRRRASASRLGAQAPPIVVSACPAPVARSYSHASETTRSVSTRSDVPSGETLGESARPLPVVTGRGVPPPGDTIQMFPTPERTE